MIEKLDLDNGYMTVDWLPTQHGKRCGAKEIQTTVNQLVDAVNELQLAKDVMFNRIDIFNNAICDMRNTAENNQSAKIAQGFKNLQDRFAEQRKWIGKLCRFRDKDYKDGQWDYGLLRAVANAETAHIWKVGCFKHNLGHWYDYCEPVLPTDNEICKGQIK